MARLKLLQSSDDMFRPDPRQAVAPELTRFLARRWNVPEDDADVRDTVNHILLSPEKSFSEVIYEMKHDAEEVPKPSVEAGVASLRPKCPLPDYPRIWSLIPYLFSRRIRKQVYEPAQQELLEDFLTARKKHRTPA